VFWRRPRIPQPYRAWIDDLVTEQQEEVYRRYTFEKRDTEAARRTLAASQEEQRGFVLAAGSGWISVTGDRPLPSTRPGRSVKPCRPCSDAGSRSTMKMFVVSWTGPSASRIPLCEEHHK
jgi:hypothetical protein